MELAVFLISLFALLPLGIPIAFILLICCAILMLFMGNFDASIIAQQTVAGTNSFALMAIPFFMLAGEIMGRGGLSRRIVDFANILVGRVRGGLGYAAIIASMIFAGLSGSPVADASALGAIMIPMMVAKGYDRGTSTGLICAGAMIAPIIPPSVPMIVLGSAVGVSIGRMFMAGIVPGVLIGMGLMALWFFIVRKHDYHDTVTYTKEETAKILKDSLPALFMPVLIVGGIRLGIFTPTEAGAFACVYALFISMFVYREVKPSDLLDIAIESGKGTAIVMFIVGAATAVGWLITVAQIPTQFAALLGPVAHRPILLLIIINIFFFFIGMVMDLTPNLLIFGPVIFPVIIAAGIDPVYFGVLMVFNLCLGLITPPVGTILYLGCSVGQVTFGRLVKSILPFLMVEFTMLFLFILFPALIRVPMNWFIG
ncbi:TRAP transporter large permease [Anaerotruncus sp. AF02-27]|uniref:TRAP transporter large permease n=1 Tax=Anaerotruncus TaxID=244127 RepID=UPI000E494078|nr:MULTISPECIES: TRAP transporter large permease [Anaerotruncus]RGX52805.1 TRAP transporter large permease [Anaerotruncus sp. AF02-27]